MPQKPKIIRKPKYKLKKRVFYIVILMAIYFIVSFAFLDIQIANFKRDEDFLRLILWIAGIVLGYVFWIFVFWKSVQRKKVEAEEEN
jgi:tellurite resistance protein TehA-like permease